MSEQPVSGGKSPAEPFTQAAIACVIPAVAGLVWSFTDLASSAPESTRAAVLVTSVVCYLTAAWLFVWPTRTRALAEPLANLPAALQTVTGQLTDLNAIRKEYNRVLQQMDGIAGQITQTLKAMGEQVEVGLASLAERQKAFDQVVHDRQKADRDLMDLRQARGDAERTVEAWKKAVLEFARLLERTGDPTSGLSEAYLKAAGKLTTDFARAFAPLGMQLIKPLAAEPFDARAHEVEGEAEDATVPPETVLRCSEWGFIVGGVVTQKAKVILAKAPAPAVAPAVAPVIAEKPETEAPTAVASPSEPGANVPAAPEPVGASSQPAEAPRTNAKPAKKSR